MDGKGKEKRGKKKAVNLSCVRDDETVSQLLWRVELERLHFGNGSFVGAENEIFVSANVGVYFFARICEELVCGF